MHQLSFAAEYYYFSFTQFYFGKACSGFAAKLKISA